MHVFTHQSINCLTIIKAQVLTVVTGGFLAGVILEIRYSKIDEIDLSQML